MKYVIIFFFIFLVKDQNCEGFKEGIFELKGDFGTLIIERKDGWQLERSVEYGLIYLNKIEPLNDCKYKLYRYKILKSGLIPKPDMTTLALTTEIVNISEHKYFFISSLEGTDMVMKNHFTKTSGEISKEFEEIIANEN